jgi:uncharacterized protein (TIGR03435 family)
VFDSTHLEGAYDLVLEYPLPTAGAGPSDPSVSPFYEPIQAVLTDLVGLRLQSAKRDLKVLKVDHAEREPIEE